MSSEYLVKQLSVLAENRSGRLAAITEVLKKTDVNILGFTLAEGEGFGVLRMLVDDPIKAHDQLKYEGFTVSYTDVICVSMDDHPGGLWEIANMLKKLNINIVYTYAFRASNDHKAVVVLRVTEMEDAIDRILEAGYPLLKETDIPS